MKIKSSVRYVCLGLIFAMLCGSVFFGSRSFAKYLEEYKNQQEAGVASPVSVYSRYALTRTQGLEEYTYTINTTDPSIVISDIAPGDELSYYFGVKSSDTTISNEVLLKVSVTFNVYLVVLKQIEVGTIKEVYPNYAGFLLGNSYSDSDDLRYKGSVSFFKNKYDEISSDDNDYELFLSAANTDKIDYTNSSLSYTTESITFTSGYSGGSYQTKTDDLYNHSIGFYMEPGVDVTKGYMIKVNLPTQSFDTASYIGAKLYIELDVNATQVQQKS